MKLSRTLLLVAALLVATTAGHAPAKTTHKPHATPATLTAAKGAHEHHDHDHHGHDHDHHGHDHAHDHDDHDHDHDLEHAHEEAARRKAQEVATKEGAHGHGANDHDHDHDGHDVAHHDHDGHHHDHAHGDGGATKAPSRAHIDRFSPKVWMEALFATALVGAAPVVVLLFVPLGLGNQEAQKPLLRVFLSFAAGGLLGDALLHLLPHSMPSGGHDHHDHSHDHGHDHGHEGHAHSIQDLAVWLYCIAGMMTFLMLEKFVRAQTGGGGDGHGHSHGGHSHGHSHSHGVAAASKTDASANARKRGVAGKALSDEEPDKSHSVNDDDKSKQPKQIAAAGYLNLAADFTHNFTDGLAIGATFLRGSGWQTTVAMLLHELPHEIGDFAILIQSGFTRREAMLTQLLTAIGAMVGTVIGLLIEGAGDSSSAWISPFTAGGFIYIACASVMPELLEDCSLAQSLKEGVAMCVGIGLMIVIALNE